MLVEKEYLHNGIKTHYIINTIGEVFSMSRGKRNKLKPNKVNVGYNISTLYINEVRHHFCTHRLVAEIFIPNPENKPLVNHINGIKDDNRVENLEWCTHSENVLHAYRTKLTVRSFRNIKRSKLSETQIVEIRQLISEGVKQRDIGTMYDVSESIISSIKRGKSYISANTEILQPDEFMEITSLNK